MRNLLHRWRARRALATDGLAPYRIGARAAGAIEMQGERRLVGWVFDVDRPGEMLALDVYVDGIKADTVCAFLKRPDLAALCGEGVAYGFDVAPKVLQTPCETRREVRVHLAHRLDHVLGPLSIAPVGMRADYGPLHMFAHITASAETTYSNQAEMTRDIRHVFDHVSATHERIITYIEALRAEGGGAASIHAPRSTLAGIGRFDERENTDHTEETIFRQKLETALVGARLSS